MTDPSRSAQDERSLKIFWTLIGIASVAMLVAAAAGLSFVLVDPAEGTKPESTLAFLAVVSGLGTGALFGVAAIYAQVKNLWRFAPKWFQYGSWAVLIVIAVVAAVSGSAAD